MENKSEIVIYKTEDGQVNLKVPVVNDDVWLNRKQLSELFKRDVKTIGKHINNALNEELADEVVVAKFATTSKHGAIENKTQTKQVEHFNLDMIISVGYRVKSNRGIQFRKWANKVLKQHIVEGYTINDNRLEQLGEVVRILQRAESQLDSGQVLNVVDKYRKALTLLDDYDHQKLTKPDGDASTYILDYDECKEVINKMHFKNDSELFGTEKDDSFKGCIGNIYQSFGGKDIYPSIQEKAANLLYFLVKDHCFLDGNKRIAATLFLYFLDKNGILFAEGVKLIDDDALAALTIMIAESNPSEKETMVVVIMNCLVGK